MARARKTAKPKQPSYERIDRKSDSQGVYDVLDAVITQSAKKADEAPLAEAGG